MMMIMMMIMMMMICALWNPIRPLFKSDLCVRLLKCCAKRPWKNCVGSGLLLLWGQKANICCHVPVKKKKKKELLRETRQENKQRPTESSGRQLIRHAWVRHELRKQRAAATSPQKEHGGRSLTWSLKMPLFHFLHFKKDCLTLFLVLFSLPHFPPDPKNMMLEF